MNRMTRTRQSGAVAATVISATLLLPTAAAVATPSSTAAQAALSSSRNHGSVRSVALPDGFRPEGITSGPGDTYYTGSLADGTIRTGDLSRGTGRVLLAGVEGRALRGMQYDHRTGLLWAVGQDGTTGIVLVVDARSGKLKHRYEIPGAGFLNDIVLTKHTAWVTDSLVDRLAGIPLKGKGSPRLLPLTGDWPVPDPTQNRANGIRELSDGSLILDNSTAGGLYSVNPRTGLVTPIRVQGGPGIVGGDGLELRGDRLYVVRGANNYEVSVLDLRRSKHSWTATWRASLTSTGERGLDVPSTATLVGKTLWAVNARFGVASPDTAPYWITPLRTR